MVHEQGSTDAHLHDTHDGDPRITRSLTDQGEDEFHEQLNGIDDQKI